MHPSMELSDESGRRALTHASVNARTRPRILVAEDEWTFRSMLSWAFEVEGYRVIGVADGRKLLEVLASSMLPNTGLDPFDLVVSDVRMPGWSGLPALEDSVSQSARAADRRHHGIRQR